MKVLVTGAAGFIGKQLVRSLLDEGAEVTGVDNFITAERADLQPLLDAPGFTFAEIDITTGEFRAFASGLSVDAVYHLACPTGVPNLVPLALEMLETSYDGSRAVLDLARRLSAPIVLTSSAEIYGDPLVSPQCEDYTGNVDTLGVRKGYEEGKRVAETLFGIYAERFGVQAKVARVFNTYGPGMRIADTRVIPSFVRSAILGEPLKVHGDGVQNRCHTFATDLVRGLRLVMEKGRPARAYNLGSTKQTTIRELAERVVQLTGTASPIEYTDRPTHDHQSRLPDTTRACMELGWEPTIKLDDGLQATISDFRARMAH
jgi:nucleoside-diphosphate-sugar epimerase